MATIDELLVEVVSQAYETGFATSSNFAREKASEVAMAASLGFITTRISTNLYGRMWRPTIAGLRFLNEQSLELEE
jgi:hypothetical protein